MNVTKSADEAPQNGFQPTTAKALGLEQAGLHLITRTAFLVGERYVAGLAEALPDVLGCGSAFIIQRGRRDAQLLQPVAVVSDGRHVAVSSYGLDVAAARLALGGAACTHSTAVRTFPTDPLIGMLDVEHIIITSTHNDDGTVNGFVGVGHRAPFGDPLATEALLRLVGSRVGAEIERLQATAELEETTGMLRAFIDRAEDLVMRTIPGPEPVVEYVNPAFETFTGYKVSELYADPELLVRIAHPDDRPAFTKLLGGDTEQRLVWRWIRRDGSTLWTEGRRTPLRDESGAVVAIENIARDITQRREAEERAAAAERITNLVVAAIPDTVICVDRHGRITNVRAQANHPPLLGEAVDGSALSSLLPGELSRDVMRSVGAALIRNEVEVLRLAHHHDDGDRMYEARIVPTSAEEAIVFFRDVTGDELLSSAVERERTKEELEVKAERRILRRNPYSLTFREYTVLELVARGLTDRQIASELSISLNTVGKHVSNILGKMQVSSRTEASVHAVQQQLLD